MQRQTVRDPPLSPVVASLRFTPKAVDLSNLTLSVHTRRSPQALKPAWEQAASALKGIVAVGAIDADAHRGMGSEYRVQVGRGGEGGSRCAGRERERPGEVETGTGVQHTGKRARRGSARLHPRLLWEMARKCAAQRQRHQTTSLNLRNRVSGLRLSEGVGGPV